MQNKIIIGIAILSYSLVFSQDQNQPVAIAKNTELSLNKMESLRYDDEIYVEVEKIPEFSGGPKLSERKFLNL